MSDSHAVHEGVAPTSWVQRSARRTGSRLVVASLDRTVATVVAIAAWFLFAVGDYLTTAEVGFTLLYLGPIAFAVWTRGTGLGLMLCFLSTLSAVATELGTGHLRPLVTTWNTISEVGVFVAFTFVLQRLKGRIETEVTGREMAVEQLRHADRLNTVGKLASGIAHELGTPLNVVSGRASMIASKRIEGEEACKSAMVIVQQTERMTAIIKNLLAFARRGGTVTASLDVSRLASETVSLLDPMARAKQCQIVLEQAAPHVAMVNPGELQQVLSNLIVNGVQSMPSGGTVRISVEQGALSRGKNGRAVAPSYVQIHIRDEGTGIPSDILPHIFDPFFTTKDVGVGTGLGLSVTFGIVQDHGGWIEVSTVVGKGTEFVVFLPQGDATPASDR